MRILFVGDLVGGIGRRTLLECLPLLRERFAPTFVVVNGENVAGGLGITPKAAKQLFAGGVDAITLGNHTYHRREIYPYLDSEPRILRPANFLRSQPGHGACVVERVGRRAPRRGQPEREPVPARGTFRVHRDRGRAGRAGGRRSDPRRHARRGDLGKGRDGLASGRARDGRRRHPHARAHRGRARAAGGNRLHHRRRHDRPARRRDRGQARAGDRVAADADAGAL